MGCSGGGSDKPTPARSSAQASASPTVSAAPAPLAPNDARRVAVESSLLPPLDLVGVELEMKLVDRMKRWGTPAVGMALIHDKALDWARTYGVLERLPEANDSAKDRPTEIRADVDTVFQAASISKPITAVAILALAEQKKLDLDAPVNRYLRIWKLDDSPYTKDHPVTIRALLSHTANINAPEQQLYTSYPESFGGYKPGARIPDTLHVLDGSPPSLTVPVAALKEPPCPDDPAKKPKPCFSYSGGGYTILQLVVEEITGQPFGDAIKRLVFDPIGMTRSSFGDAPPSENAARAHRGDAKTPPGGWIVVAEKAAGGLWSTPSDLARFVLDVSASYRGEAGHVLSQASAKAMLTPVADARPLLQSSIGLGMFVSDDSGELVFSHNGHNPGYHATIVAMPDRGEGLVLMTNREVGAELMGEIGNAVGQVYDWPARTGMRARQKTVVPVTFDAIKGFVGTYTGGGLFEKPLRATVRTEGPRLFAKVDELDEAEVYAIGEGEFVAPFAPAVLRFKVAPDGASLEYDSPAGKRTADRNESKP